MSTEVRKNVKRHRYEITIGDDVVGYVTYEQRGAAIALPHTFVDPEHRGGNLARRLVTFALDDIRTDGLGVVPVCPYVARVIARNPDPYLDLVPEPARAEFGLR